MYSHRFRICRRLAAEEDSESAWLDYLGQAPEGQDVDKGFERLQKSAKARASAWLTTEAAQVAPDEVDIPSPLDAGQVRRDLQEADATMARFLLPREFSVASQVERFWTKTYTDDAVSFPKYWSAKLRAKRS